MGLGDDPFLTTLSIKAKNFLMASYVLHLATGHTLSCSTIKSDTISLYLSAAVHHFTALGHPDPTRDPNYRRFYLIESILKEAKRCESVPDRKEPVTWDMIHWLMRRAAGQPHVSLDAAMTDWLVLGMYTGFRISEWATPNSYQSPNVFQLARDGSCLAINATDMVLSPPTATNLTVTIRWRWQKNGQNGQRISFCATPNHPDRCRWAAAKRILLRAQLLNILPTSPLSWFLDGSTPKLIMDSHITATLREAAAGAHNITDPEALGTWTSHSIRVGACVALHEAGADGTFLKKRLRWESDTFMVYLRNTPKLALQHARLLETDPVAFSQL